MEDTIDKHTLLERMELGRRALAEILDALPAVAERADPAGWTVKDHLSHIAAWEEVALARVEGETGSDALRSVAGGGPIEEDIDALNERIRAHHAGEDLAAARARWDRVHDRLREALGRVPEERLAQPFDPDRPQVCLADTVADNTYNHYEEHLAVIRKLTE